VRISGDRVRVTLARPLISRHSDAPCDVDVADLTCDDVLAGSPSDYPKAVERQRRNGRAHDLLGALHARKRDRRHRDATPEVRPFTEKQIELSRPSPIRR
jgi:hypothetical protein